MTDARDNQMASKISETRDGVDILREELVREINRLNRFSTRGIQALGLFLVVSTCAWLDFPFFPTPDTVIALLGNPPSSRIVSTVLLLYTFSALILGLSRMTTGVEHRSSFSHVGYLAAFFLFYYFGKSLHENYWAVFGAGITILGVESYRIWSFCTEGISKKREDIEYMTRTGKPPLQD